MGVSANTATAVPDKWPDIPGAASGFTGGDPQAGVAPTQLDPEYFNAVTEEINAVIAILSDGTTVPAFTVDDRQQMAEVLMNAFVKQLGNSNLGDVLWSRRTFPSSTVTAAEKDWREWIRDGYAKNVAANTVNSLCFLSLPNDSQALIEVSLSVVKVSDITDRLLVKFVGAVKKTGGTANVQDYDILYTNGSLGATVDILASSGNVFVQVSIAPDVGQFYNIHATMTAVNVTTSTVA